MLNTDYNTLFQKQLDKLNAAQKQAVESIEGPVMVIAGPGTGKTQILSARIGNILTQPDTRPGNILCLTYTEAGTVAMRRRLLEMIGPDAYRVYIYTFHGFCNEVIQARPDYFGKNALEPISEIENIDLLQQLINDLPVDHPLKKLKGDSGNIPRLNSLFQMMKQEGWTPTYVKERVELYLADLPTREEFIYKRASGNNKKGDIKAEAIAEETRKMNDLLAAADLLPVYQQMMFEKERYDYADMLAWVLRAFNQDPYLLRTYQERFQYILVDEFQDTGGVQVALLYKLLEYWGDQANIFVVGDDDQCIFEFQNARVKNILDFHERFEQYIKTIVLTDNYRSSQPILDAAKRVIDNNANRLIRELPGTPLDKTLVAQGQDVVDIKTPPQVIQYPNPAQEAVDIVHSIQQRISEGVSPQQIAVIYYKHAQANTLIEVLEKLNIAYQVKRPLNVLDEPLVDNLLWLMRYLSAEAYRAHSGEAMLFRILHFRFLGIAPHDVAHVASYLANQKEGVGAGMGVSEGVGVSDGVAEDSTDNVWKRKQWRELLQDSDILNKLHLKDAARVIEVSNILESWIQDAHNLTMQMLFGKILNDSGLMAWVLTQPKKAYYLEALRTLYDHVKSENARNTRLTIKEFTDTIEQMRRHNIALPLDKSYTNTQAVQLLTCHGAKGLEFEYVYMLGCSNSQWNDSRGNGTPFRLPDTITYAREESKLESMRRLFYVGMTRAKRLLTISFAQTDAKGKSDAPAQFITEFITKNDAGALDIETRSLEERVMLEYDIELLSLPTQPVAEVFDDAYMTMALQGFTMSASHLNKYLKCPLAFYYENVLRIPSVKTESTAFGSAIHFALNREFEKMKASPEKVFPTKEEMIKDFAWYMNRQKDSFTDIQFTNRMALGEKVIGAYYDNYAATWTKDVLTEHRISNIEINGVPLKGFLDKVELKGRDVHVVDYKTGDPHYAKPKLTRVAENEGGGEYWRQMVFYKILVDSQVQYDWRMATGEVNFIEKDSKKDNFVKHTYVIEPDEVEQVKKEVKHVYTKIMNHEFSVGCGDDDCEWCNFVKDNDLVKL